MKQTPESEEAEEKSNGMKRRALRRAGGRAAGGGLGVDVGCLPTETRRMKYGCGRALAKGGGGRERESLDTHRPALINAAAARAPLHSSSHLFFQIYILIYLSHPGPAGDTEGAAHPCTQLHLQPGLLREILPRW